MAWQDYFSEHLRSLDDLDWLLAPDDFPELVDFMDGVPGGSADTVTKWGSTRNPLLVLFHRSGDPYQITRVVLLVPARSSRLLKSLKPDHFAGDFSIKIHEPALGDSSTTVFHAVIKTPEDRTCIAALVSQIFSLFLTTGRPLRHYNCSFLLPLDLKLDEELEINTRDLPAFQSHQNPDIERYRITPPKTLLSIYDDKKSIPDYDDANAQAYEFFYPHLRDQLFETIADTDDPIKNVTNKSFIKPIVHRRIRPQCLVGMRINLIDAISGSALPDTKVVSAVLEDVSLFQYYSGLYLLAIRVGLPENALLLQLQKNPASDGQEAYAWLISDGDDWWYSLVYSVPDQWKALQCLQIESWLRYTKTVRLLFSSFLEQKREDKIARLQLCRDNEALSRQEINSHFSPVIVYLLKKFLPALPDRDLTRYRRLRQIADDRMFVHVAYALSGPSPDQHGAGMEEFERLFSYALYVDQHTDASYSPDQWVYDQCYTRELMEQHVLSRWRSINSLSGYTNASSVFMGFGNYFQSPVAAIHVPYIYIKIQILALLFRATLDQFDRRIAVATQDLTKKDDHSEAFRWLRRDFILFTNNYWFRQLSPQVQGEEITNRMMQQQRLQGKYELVKDKMERADEYVATLYEQWIQNRADRFGGIAGTLGLAALFLTAVGIFYDKDIDIKQLLVQIIMGLAFVGACYIWIRGKRKHRQD